MQKIRKKKEGHYIEEGRVNVEAWHLSGNDTQLRPCHVRGTPGKRVET